MEFTHRDVEEAKKMSGEILRNTVTSHHPAITWLACALSAKIIEVGSDKESSITDKADKVEAWMKTVMDKKFHVDGVPDNQPEIPDNLFDALQALKDLLEAAKKKGIKVQGGLIKNGEVHEIDPETGETKVTTDDRLKAAIAGLAAKNKDVN